MNDNYKFSYIALCPGCGVVVAATIDHPNRKKTTARHTSQWIREGYTVERILSDQVGALFQSCTCSMSDQLPLFPDE